MRGNKFSSKKAYIKVEGEDSCGDSSSEGKSDHVSFSYSCVKSFRKNQHIIGDLAALYNQQKYNEITHQPALFSLSGERNRPICQPFYCSTVSDNSSEEDVNYSENHQVVEKEKKLTKSESQQQIPVKTMLFQWMKNQFKQVNSLWSLTIPKEFFIQKLCKRNQKMKMEMTLNSIDEETKRRLVDYINNSNLGFEEHRNLCNETVFEIDVTSILDDTDRLQRFLKFLKNIESEKSKVSNKNLPDLNEPVDKDRLPERKNVKKKYVTKNMSEDVNQNLRKSAVLEKHIYQTRSLSETSAESTESLLEKPKQNTLGKNSNDQDSITEDKLTHPKCDKDKEIKKLPQGKKRARHRSTLSGTNDVQNMCTQPLTNSKENDKFANQKKVCFNVQTNVEINKTPLINAVTSESSCKCLMHNPRADYYRYKNQCLFGKGDEMTNSFIKFVNHKENQSKPSFNFDENNLNSFPSETYDEKIVDKLYVSKTNEVQVTKTNIHFDENSKTLSRKADLDSPREDYIEQNLYSQDQYIDSLAETFCSSKFPLLTNDDYGVTKDRDLKVSPTNACFESLSYYFDSVLNTTNESTPRKNTLERNDIYCSMNYDSRRLEESTNRTENSFELSDKNCDTQLNRKITQTTFENRCNIDFGVANYSPQNVHNVSKSTLINEGCSGSAKCNAKLTNNNGDKNRHKSELQECNLSEKDISEDVGDGKPLHSLTNNTSVSSGNKIFKDSHISSLLNCNDSTISYLQKNKRECSVFGSDCEKQQRKIKTIVLRIGSSDKQFRINTIPASKKKDCKLKSRKAKQVCEKISSVFKGNVYICNEEQPVGIWNNIKTYKTTNYSSIGETSPTNKSDTVCDSLLNYEDYESFIDSLTSRSKGTTQTCTTQTCTQPCLVDPESSSLIFNNLDILASELKNQRREIDYMKKLLSSQIT